MTTTTDDGIHAAMIDSLADAARLRDDGQSIKADNAFGEALAWYYDATGCQRMPKWLAEQLSLFSITVDEARKMQADFRRGAQESALAEVVHLTPEPVEQVVDAEVVTDLDEAAARELTDEIKESLGAVFELVIQAYIGRAWLALGYSTWKEYCTNEFDTAPMRLPRDDRAEWFQALRSHGLSIRGIAAATGHDEKTVHKYLKSGVGNSHTSTVTGTNGVEQPAEKPKKEPKKPKPGPNLDLDQLDSTKAEPTPLPTPEWHPHSSRLDAIRELVGEATQTGYVIDEMLTWGSIEEVEQPDEIGLLAEARDMLADCLRRIQIVTIPDTIDGIRQRMEEIAEHEALLTHALMRMISESDDDGLKQRAEELLGELG